LLGNLCANFHVWNTVSWFLIRGEHQQPLQIWETYVTLVFLCSLRKGVLFWDREGERSSSDEQDPRDKSSPAIWDYAVWAREWLQTYAVTTKYCEVCAFMCSYELESQNMHQSSGASHACVVLYVRKKNLFQILLKVLTGF